MTIIGLLMIKIHLEYKLLLQPKLDLRTSLLEAGYPEFLAMTILQVSILIIRK